MRVRSPGFSGGLTSTYLGAIFPPLGALIFQGLVITAQPFPRVYERLTVGACLASGLVLPVIGHQLPSYELIVLAPALGLLFLCLAKYRATRKRELLLTYIALALLTLLLFLPEVTLSLLTGRQPGKNRLLVPGSFEKSSRLRKPDELVLNL